MLGGARKANNVPALGALVGLLLAGAACSVATDPSTILSAAGTVTHDGAPAAAIVTLSAGASRTSSQIVPDGAYQLNIQGGVPESGCPSAHLHAALLGDGEEVIAEQEHAIGACGSHQVDFEFP